jgi:predicted RNase H-like nuclease (RuvC/YqgF family)
MHIFIVSNIVEHTTLNNTITPIPSTSTTGEDKYELENIKTKLEAQIASLQSQAASSSTINKDTLTELKKECEILTKSLLEKNNKIAELKALLESYKELLLDSTQLIFKMDDIDISKS